MSKTPTEAAYELARRIWEHYHPMICAVSTRGCEIYKINAQTQRHSVFVLAASPTDHLIYVPSSPEFPSPSLKFPTSSIRWFGFSRYRSDEIGLYIKHDEGWTRLKLHLYPNNMEAYAQALNYVVPQAYGEELASHYGPVQAKYAQENVLGSWELEGDVDLYLAPTYLLLLNGPVVQQAISVSSICELAAFKRPDQPHLPGLIRLSGESGAYTFALKQYEEFALHIARAANRPLDTMQRKKKKDEPEDD